MDKATLFSRKKLSFFLKEKGIFLSRSRGQNFLLDRNILKKIVESLSTTEEDIILEIGAGIGHLSFSLLEKIKFKKYILIEIDKKLIEILKEQFKDYPNVFVLHKDFLKLKIENLYNRFSSKIIIIGNLPYSKVGLILRKFIGDYRYIHKAYITVQREVGQRLVATSNNKKYGFLSLLMQIYSQVKALFLISSKVFFPIPKVDSVFLEIDFDKNCLSKIKNKNFFFSLLKIIFLYRRKSIKKILKKEWEISEKDFLVYPLIGLEKILLMRIESLTKDEIIQFINCIMKILKEKGIEFYGKKC